LQRVIGYLINIPPGSLGGISEKGGNEEGIRGERMRGGNSEGETR
jgi:hypothetical protein